MSERRRLGALGGLADHGRDAAHLQSCAECRGALETERRYLAALRGAPVPAASSALTQRLIEQTRELALEAELAEAASSKGRMLRAAAVALTGAAAALAALAVTAYAVAGDPTAASPTASWPSAVGIDNGGRVLTATDLQALSAAGWNCPELERSGLHVESAKGYILNGVPTLVLRIGDGAHAISLMEQRPGNGGTPTPQTTVLASDFPSSETANLVRESVPRPTPPPAESPADRLARGLHLVLSAAGRP
ncbi:hypothetical protein [Sinomonas terrae]|uniref:Anti-sigma factor n=1 Tax=Sinomonas terrae TaxID=2908838 RepID=A0ABS9TZQ0_9MICC|nr:hypothetical protein [Sinomonas terrae]MCH6469540.1 hypothetical protein [Sinomonas terrae]